MCDLSIIQCDPEVPAGVIAELLSEWRVPFQILRADLGARYPVKPGAVIILGGAMGVHEEARHPFLRPLKEFMAGLLVSGTPQLGICLGGQLLAAVAGGVVTSNSRGEKGVVEVGLTADGAADDLFAGIDRRFRVFQWHNDSFTVPPGARHLAGSSACPGQVFRLGQAWGVQFHPEVDAAIVASWSRQVENGAGCIDQFISVEARHRQLCRELLINFLRVAGLCPC